MANNVADHTSKKYGKLTVIERDYEHKKSRGTSWLVKCECGNIVSRLASELIKGKKNNVIQSCSKTCGQTLDLKGREYGFLTAIERLDKTARGWNWKFKCDCGNTTIKNGAQVSRLHGALHCGCKPYQGKSQIMDLTGNVYGKLKVIKRNGIAVSGQAIWNCECECGNVIPIKAHYLRRGKTHCGCSPKRQSNNHSFKGHEEIYRSYWTRAQNGAKSRNLDFNITIEYAWDIYLAQSRLCALSGVELKMGGNSSSMTASLDRIDSSKGYIEGNVQWLHKDINRIKMDLNQDDFIAMCTRVHEHTNNTGSVSALRDIQTILDRVM